MKECCAIGIAHWPTYSPWITLDPGTLDSMQPSGWKTTALKAEAGTAPELYELHESSMERQKKKKKKERKGTEQWLRVNREGVEEWNGSDREEKGVRDGEEKLGCYVYCWQFTHAHSIWDPISCQIGKAMGMWERQESQQGLNSAHHWDLIKTQSRSLPEQTHTGPHPYTHSLHSHSYPSKVTRFHTNTVKQTHT